MPARAPAARSVRARRTGACAASTWKVTLAAPASAYAGAQRSGSSIMRWQSTGSGLVFRIDSTIGTRAEIVDAGQQLARVELLQSPVCLAGRGHDCSCLPQVRRARGIDDDAARSGRGDGRVEQAGLQLHQPIQVGLGPTPANFGP